MVAATNPAVNNVLAKALNANAAQQGSAAQGSGNAQNANTDAADDNEFNNLLNIFLGNDANASSSANGVAVKQPASTGKDDQKADADADATNAATAPQWLLTPLAMPGVQVAAPAIATANTASSDNADNAVAALAPANGMANSAATNAVLAQTLKKLNDDKNDGGADKSSAPAPDFLLHANGDQNGQSAAVLKQDASTVDGALLAMADKGKDTAHHGGDADQTINALQPMTSMQTASAANNAAPVAQYQIHSNVGTHEWAAEVGNRLSLMVSHKVQSASLQLTPDNLGPVQVKIDVNHNQASVWFTADHPDTRTALEQSLPRLRELFASQGMSLMDAGVFGQHSQQQPAYTAPSPTVSSGMVDMSGEVTTTQQVLKVGLLDTYA
ncbi:MAG TPA: flagellar hook-length control protein FliK [Steroidobacteraceae bacterium]|nr:flagellar hook-length control protein FliK [Steroidobacteraceae bacterium]